jgi:hypothetical protein
MNGSRSLVALVALLLVACRGAETPEAEMDAGMEMDTSGAAVTDMEGMDHSQHLGGAPAERQAVHLTPQQERALGVRYASVERRSMERTIRTVGRIVASEARIADVTPKVEGFVESLVVGTTGAKVRRGQPLLTLFSPELVAAQEELIIAARLA